MSSITDLLITAIITYLFMFIIDPLIARKIITNYGEIKVLNYKRHRILSLWLTFIIPGIIAGLVYTFIGLTIGSEFILKYDYIILTFVAFLGGIPIQVFLQQKK
jgi:hypothetical protein